MAAEVLEVASELVEVLAHGVVLRAVAALEVGMVAVAVTQEVEAVLVVLQQHSTVALLLPQWLPTHSRTLLRQVVNEVKSFSYATYV